MKIFVIKFLLVCLFYFQSISVVNAEYTCTGHYKCTERVRVGSVFVCSETVLWTKNCTGANSVVCVNGDEYDTCDGDCYTDETCSWDWIAPPACNCSWVDFGGCYVGGGGACIKGRTCSCSPSGCGSCSGDNFTFCPVTCDNKTQADCPSYCGYTGGNIEGGVSGCGCSDVSCPAVTCCTPSNPEAPTLVSPANAAIYNVGSTINFDWNAIGLWGTGCPQNNKYTICVSSNQTSCDNVYANTSASVTNYVWTSSVADSYVTWNVQSHNGSNGTYSTETRNFCVEGVSCALQCGQTTNCSGACGSSDAGTPVAPTVVSPLGSAINPVILFDTTPLLDWDGSDPLTDSYEINVINPAGTVVWTGTTTAGTTNVSVGVALSNNITYRWYTRALNSTCTPVYSLPSGYGYFRINSPPVIGAFSIHNSIGTAVPAEAGSRNHICQSDFNNSRDVNFQLSVTDADGVDDIDVVSLTWATETYVLNRGTTWATGAIYSNTIDYTPTHNQNIYEIGARAVDFSGATVNQGTGRNWKVWNCQVPVSGNMYDGSADHSCVGGFNSLADSAMGFNALIFSNSTESVMATVIIPDTFGPNNLFWSRSYLPYINGGNAFNPNGDLAATARMTRMIDLGTGTTSCPVNDQFNLDVSAYSLTPSAQIDFSFIRDQESWYQVRGGGIRAGDSIESGVPVTANPLERYLTLGRNLPTTINNGLVSYAINFSNTNGFNEEAYGSPNSWWKNSSLLPATRYGYLYFYNNLYVKAGVGVTGRNWGEKPSEGVFFVDGNLNIDSNFVLPADKFFMVVVSGSITIANGVTQIDGIYVSDGEISATGNSNNALEINGMLYSKSNVRLARSFVDKTLNNTTPATVVNYQPSLLFSMPIKISKIISGWREE